jgi:hypothetical protein
VRDFGIVTVSEAFRFEIDGWELAKGLDMLNAITSCF